MAGGNAGGAARVLFSILGLALALPLLVAGDDPYRFFTWTVTYGDIYPLGVKQQGILINNQFPGPQIEAVTNDNLIINVFNKLNEPFLLSWSGLQQRRNSFEDGVAGTTCPIPPGSNFTYIMQAKDQIGTYYYFPSLAFHKAAGGFGGIRVLSRPQIPVPFPPPAADYTVLIGDWYKANHTDLRYVLDSGVALGFPDGLLINGRGLNGYDYAVVVSTRFTSRIISTTAVLRYANSAGRAPGPLPGGPTIQIDWSLNQARSVRWNLTASGPRPNPQGSYHYGLVPVTRTIRLANSAATIGGKRRYAVNGASYVGPDTPLKVADYYKIGGVFSVGTIADSPPAYGGAAYLRTSVMGASYRDYVEVVFENGEDEVQSWHIDGYAFWVVGMDGGKWSSASRQGYNLRDGVSRYTVQVYPRSWTAIYMPLDNVGMWNVRSENWARQYLGQQFYLRVWTPSTSLRDEYPIPKNALLCGRAAGRRTRPL
ncbi:SKU5 similar 4 [Zea mays]|uniref:SKU5 similar 4 n=1 Tax=Zea mays TaxID=4577 RepID=A0A1D6ICM9_MAIZE|nr:SKU5 similar 4 [Zea mays]